MRLDDPDFERHSAVTHALPNACTTATFEDWRKAADAFLAKLQADGYVVVSHKALNDYVHDYHHNAPGGICKGCAMDWPCTTYTELARVLAYASPG